MPADPAVEQPQSPIIGLPIEVPIPEVNLPDDVVSPGGADEGEDDKQPQLLIDNPIASSANSHDQNQVDIKQLSSPQEKSKSNSNYYYVGGGAIAGVFIGLTIAYLAGAPAVAVFIAAAAVGALIGGIGGCLSSPKVSNGVANNLGAA